MITKRPEHKQLTTRQVVAAIKNKHIIDVHRDTGIAKQTIAKLLREGASERAYSTRIIEVLSNYILDDLESLAESCGVKVVY